MNVRPLLALVAVVVIAGLVSLGRWQWHRAYEKESMLQAVATSLRERRPEPLTLADRPAGYDWAAGSGRFLPAPALLLDNQRRGDRVGVHVFGIFVPDAGGHLLVDLGWLPVAGDRKLPDVPMPRGTVQVQGLLTPPTAAGLAIGPAYTVADPQRWLLTRLDLSALTQGLRLSLAPRILRLDPALPIGYARDLQILPNTLPPARHRAYAVQWFALAATVAAISLFLSFRRTPR